jgi:UDP-glucose 4-epimerase
MEHKTVAITGGAGFIGSKIAQDLARQNTIIIIDDLSTGSITNIENLLEQNNVSFIHGSILDLTLLQDNFRQVDFVLHQAAVASVPQSIEDPLLTNEVNVTGTLNVLLAARDNHVNKVIFASSCSVYGDSQADVSIEDMPLNPQSPYATSKLAGEYYCLMFEQVFDLPTTCLRYFNVYGPGQSLRSDYATVVPAFVDKVRNGQRPVIYGNGSQTRDFIYVKDIVKANLWAAESEVTGVFNIGYGESTTVNELAHTVISLFGNNLEPIYDKPRLGDPVHSRADISKAVDYGFKPEYTLKKGLEETIKTN